MNAHATLMDADPQSAVATPPTETFSARIVGDLPGESMTFNLTQRSLAAAAERKRLFARLACIDNESPEASSLNE